MLYDRIIKQGTINEPGGKPDPQFALPSTVNWMHALRILVEDQGISFATADAFYNKQGKRTMDVLVENKVMEQLEGTGTWLNQTDWVSPGGLTYSTAPDLSQGHRVSHVFSHTIPDPAKPQHSIFSVTRKDVLGLVDEGWGKQNKFHPLKPDGTPDAIKFKIRK